MLLTTVSSSKPSTLCVIADVAFSHCVGPGQKFLIPFKGASRRVSSHPSPFSFPIATGSEIRILGIRSQRDGLACYLLTSLDGGPLVNTSTTDVIPPNTFRCDQPFFTSDKVYYKDHVLEVTVGWNSSDCFNFVGADVEEDTGYLDPNDPANSASPARLRLLLRRHRQRPRHHYHRRAPQQ